MSFEVKYDDFNQYCYDTFRKHIIIVQFYLDGCTVPSLRQSYKDVMNNILDQQKIQLIAEARKQEVFDLNIEWLEAMYKRVDLL